MNQRRNGDAGVTPERKRNTNAHAYSELLCLCAASCARSSCLRRRRRCCWRRSTPGRGACSNPNGMVAVNLLAGAEILLQALKASVAVAHQLKS